MMNLTLILNPFQIPQIDVSFDFILIRQLIVTALVSLYRAEESQF